MRFGPALAVLLGVSVSGSASRADVTDPTPYNYDHPPRAGREGGTWAFSGTGSAGPDCIFVMIGGAKFLPDGAGTGGDICIKVNLKVQGSGPVCALAPLIDPVLATVKGTYRVNGDGTLCEQGTIVGGPFDGMVFTNHIYVDPKGNTLVLSDQDIAYPCPGEPANGQAIFSATAMRIGKSGDDPRGSGTLRCP
jgi:hypothetical protein